MSEKDRYTQALEYLRKSEEFRLVLKRIKYEFRQRIQILGECPRDDAEKHRGVISFMERQYQELAGEGICGDESLE